MTRTTTRHLALFGLMVLMLVSWSGCKSGPEDNSKLGVYMVKEKQTGFYRFGPAQNQGPDFNLNTGQRVAMLVYDRAFSKVMTEDGFSGYVATEDLKVAPPPPKQQRLASSIGSPGGRRSRPLFHNSEVLESGPLFDQFNLPPLPEDPEPEASPPPDSRAVLPLPQ